ncbi:TonB family protein [Pseudoalteromonas luteoviolacea]|uniref:energy transducer TonB n=1 Tax=Pseudoalteromonas luteoviolacea TaxID=43657 RepID=UPI001EEF26EA|nr:energy transducer TonB [Pseudoalteromonas luteoviolacea]MCF6440608.1 TonB family protein [Pseudoalteromonas luteoviolacea]
MKKLIYPIALSSALFGCVTSTPIVDRNIEFKECNKIKLNFSCHNKRLISTLGLDSGSQVIDALGIDSSLDAVNALKKIETQHVYDTALINYHIGSLYLKSDMKNEALIYFEHAAKNAHLNPNEHKITLQNLAELSFSLGHYDAAKIHILKYYDYMEITQQHHFDQYLSKINSEKPNEANSPTLTHRVAPKHPEKAVKQGINGYVQLTFDLNKLGEPTNITVLKSKPQGVFEKEAILALEKWRYRVNLTDTGNVIGGQQLFLQLNFLIQQ